MLSLLLASNDIEIGKQYRNPSYTDYKLWIYHLLSCQKCSQIINSPDGFILHGKNNAEQQGLFSLMTKSCKASVPLFHLLKHFLDDKFSQIVPSFHENPLLNNVCLISLYDKFLRWKYQRSSPGGIPVKVSLGGISNCSSGARFVLTWHNEACLLPSCYGKKQLKDLLWNSKAATANFISSNFPTNSILCLKDSYCHACSQ
jgi:hypothetical protein